MQLWRNFFRHCFHLHDGGDWVRQVQRHCQGLQRGQDQHGQGRWHRGKNPETSGRMMLGLSPIGPLKLAAVRVGCTNTIRGPYFEAVQSPSSNAEI